MTSVPISLVPRGAITHEAMERVVRESPGSTVVADYLGRAGAYRIASAAIVNGEVTALAEAVEPDAHQACEIASRSAGPGGPQWNREFVRELDRQGFELIDPESDRGRGAVWALTPYDEGWRYSYPAAIVRKQRDAA